jgi:predicted DCC family thiol-disulfide oxidoreductase YuxK
MTEVERGEIEGRALLLYDGVCALCHGVVGFLLKRDRGGRLRFAPLQSALGRETMARFGVRETPDGVLLVVDALRVGERLYWRSDAVAVALGLLGGGWGMVGKLLRLVPRGLRELGYGAVARVRYRVFGRYAACPLPPPGLRNRLLGVVE